MTSRGNRDSERGLALLVVLWVVAAAAMLVAAFSGMARSGVSLVVSEMELTRAGMALEAGVEIAAARLIDEDDERRWLPDGDARNITFGGFDVSIRITDPNGLVDLNKSDERLLMDFLGQFAGGGGDTERLHDQILSVREKSPGRRGVPTRRIATIVAPGVVSQRVIGSRRADFAQTPAFIDVSQLRRLEGMSPTLYRQLEPFVTVHSKDGRINPTYAPSAVRAALSGSSGQASQGVGDRPQNGDTERKSDTRRSQQRTADGSGPAYIVSVAVRRRDAAYRASRQYVIGIGFDEDAPYRVLSVRTTTAQN
jgi:general secretion pathway protein K